MAGAVRSGVVIDGRFAAAIVAELGQPVVHLGPAVVPESASVV